VHTTSAVAEMRIKSFGVTARMFPKSSDVTSLKLRVTLIIATPSAKNPVKITPIAVSSRIVPRREIQPMPTAVRMPATSAPPSKLHPCRYAATSPGSAVCDTASPMNAIRRSTT
jgi:hypothetical protein